MRGRAVAFGVALGVGVGCSLALGIVAPPSARRAPKWHARSAPVRSPGRLVGVSRANIEIAEVVYDGKLAAGWEDWGWGPHEIPDGGRGQDPVRRIRRAGAASHEELSPHFGGVTFKFRAPAGYRDFLDVRLQYQQRPETDLPRVPVDPST